MSHTRRWAADEKATVPDTPTETRQTPAVTSMELAADERSLSIRWLAGPSRRPHVGAALAPDLPTRLLDGFPQPQL